MSKKKKFLKIFLWIITIIFGLFLAAVIGAYCYFHFYLIPKVSDNSDILGEGDISISDVARDLSDKQIIDNILNFDKESASEMLTALNELETEIEGAQNDVKENVKPSDKDSKSITSDGKNAYQRIMKEADKDDISEGLAIIAKVDISRVNELRKQGKNDEIKEYLKSVLTSGEISAALRLYNKYKHLL